MSLETEVQGWLAARVAAEPPGQPLQGVQVGETAFDRVTSERVVLIGPAESNFAPTGAGLSGEYGSSVVLIVMVRVAGREPASYKAAREAAIGIAGRIAYLSMFEDNDLGGRVRDSLPGKFARDFGPHDGHAYAVGNLPLYVNVAGQSVRLE